jgi:prefoldin subunit 5
VEHHDERADELEREADKLQEHTEDVGGRIDDVRKEWQSKQEDASVPGAQPPAGDDPDDDDEQE